MNINAKRSISVVKYTYTLEQNVVYPDSWKTEPVGKINNIISATIEVSDFGDPVPTIICELNDNNIKAIKNGYLLKMRANSYNKVDTLFTIINTHYNTNNKTITVNAEVQFNEARNGTFIMPIISVSGSDLLADYGIQQQYFSVSPMNVYGEYKVRNDSMIKPNYDMGGGRLGFSTYYKGKTQLTAIGGSQGSIADLFGGEFDKTLDSHRVYQVPKLGRYYEDRVLNTSLQLDGIEYTNDSTNIVNGVVHIFEWKPEGLSDTAPKRIIWGKEGDDPSWGNDRNLLHLAVYRLAEEEARWGTVLVKDWSSEGEALGDPAEIGEDKVKTNLIKQAKNWNAANKNKGKPVETLKFDFVSLRERVDSTDEFGDYVKLFDFHLGDSVKVRIKELDKVVTGRISGYTYNVLTDTYDKMIVGNSIRTIVNKIKE